MTLEYELALMKQALSDMPGKLRDIARAATQLAVNKAQELTPPTEDDLSGTNTRTGALKSHWANDSVIEPEEKGDAFVTHLNNDLEYASYVNDGHRMDRHFVPGLWINPYNGMLERAPAEYDGGIMVGTKTAYVPGLFMADKAVDTYSEAVDNELEKLTEDLE